MVRTSALFFLTVIAAAQTRQFEGSPIASVTFEPSVQPLAPEDLAERQFLKRGGEFHSKDASAMIDRLFETGRYEDLQIDVQPNGDQVAIRVITQASWFVGHVAVDGQVKSPPTRTQIIEASRLSLGEPFEDDDLTEAKRNLERLMERNGLYEHKINIETSDEPGIQQRDIKFVVAAGPRARYTRPIIEGNPILSADTIYKATGWKWKFLPIWRKVTQDRTRRGVAGVLKRYRKDDRLTAEVRNQDPQYDPETGRLTTTLRVEPGPKVEINAAEADISNRKLKKYVPVFEELTVNRDLLVEGAANLRDYFQSQGYYQAEVDFRERQEDPDHLVIEYVISQGKRLRLVNIDIQGNRYFSTDDIRERMFLLVRSFRIRRGRFSDGFLKRDIESIKSLYKSNGFQDVDVVSAVADGYKGKTGDVSVTITIDEGPQWHVRNLTLTGIQSVALEPIEAQLNSIEKQPFSDVNVASDRNVVLTAYHAAGFPDASFQWKPVPNSADVDLEYVIEEGRRQYVRELIVRGVATTRPRMVNRHLTLKPGDPLSLVQMGDIQRRLYQLGLFSRIDMAIQNPGGVASRKYVLYDFEEASRYSVAVGVGAEFARIGGPTTDLSQPAGATGFSPRFSVDLSRLNFLGLGHTATLRGRVSNLQQMGSFSYLAPRFRNVEGRNITFTALYDVSRDVRTFSSRREEASIQVSQQLSKPSSILLRFAYRRVTTGDLNIPSLLVPQLLQPVRVGILSANYVQDRRDNSADPHRGIYNTLDFGVASSIFGSQRTFLRGLGRDATYHPITRNLVLARQTTFGVIFPFHTPTGFSQANVIPLPERFFGGGSITHRGFPQNQAGPRDIGSSAEAGGAASPPTGFPLGGNALLFNLVELRFPLIGDNISGVLFHDMGNIFSTVGNISFRMKQRDLNDFNYMVHAAGFGVRYKTPVGPVRVDLSYSVNPPRFLGFKGTVQELLQCGPPGSATACAPVEQGISHFQFFFSIGQTF